MLERAFQEPNFHVCCLGGFKLVEAGSDTDMTPASRKARALIGYLCIVGKPVGRERLASLLWGDRGDEQARASLRQAIYELRSMLAGNRLLKMERDTVAIGEDVSTDIAAITAAAQSGDLAQLEQALSSWRGDFFEDMPSIDESFDTWLQSERLRVQESLINAAADAAKSGMERGEIDPARKIVNLLQQRDGTNEIVLRLGLRLDHLAGDTGALHRRYERFRELLKTELAAAPALETQRLFHELTSSSPASAQVLAFGSMSNIADRAGGYVQHSEDSAARPVPPPTWPGHRMMFAAGALAVAFVGALAWAAWSFSHKAVPSREEPLLAVLPFQNLSADVGSRYFSDGITEEIVDALLRITQIRVASPRSSFRFRDSSAADAAKALDATDVLSGSVERDGDRVHIVAKLTDVPDNRVIWSRAYDRAIAQMPALRHDIAVQIADALDMRLSSSSLDEAQHVNPAAYDHYLKGQDLFQERKLAAAATELEASVRLAPSFAKAWATLAAVRVIRVSYGEADAASLEIAAWPAAQRALALDPNDGEALAVLADLTPSTHLPESDRLWQRALRSEPNNAQLLTWHSTFLIFVGRDREALDELARAYELDRVTPTIATALIDASLVAGRFEEARQIIDLNRDNPRKSVIFYLHAEYFLFRRDWSGLANYLRVLPDYLSPRMAATFRLYRETALALAANASGRFGRLSAIWRSGPSVNANDAVDPDLAANTVDAVQFLTALGDTDGALEVVQSNVARAQRNDHFFVDPGWDALFPTNLAALRSDPRVPALFAKWRLFDYWRTTNHWPDFCFEPGLPFDCRVEAQKLMRADGQRR